MNNSNEFSFSEWLEEELKKQGVSVMELSERSGVSAGSIYKYKKCSRSPSIMAVIDIMNALGKRIGIVDKDVTV